MKPPGQFWLCFSEHFHSQTKGTHTTKIGATILRFFRGGTVQAKAVDSAMIEKMQFWAAMGHQCAPDFIADKFLNEDAEDRWMRGLLRDTKTQPWAMFTDGGK